MKKKLFLLLFSVIFISASVFAQMTDPVKWSTSVKKVGNDEVDLVFTANINLGWDIYTQYFAEGGPIRMEFTFHKSPNYKLVGKTKESPAPHKKMDELFGIEIQYFKGKGSFTQRIKVLSEKDFELKTSNYYQACNDEQCIPFEKDFALKVKGVVKEKTPEEATEDETETSETEVIETQESDEDTAAAITETPTKNNTDEPAKIEEAKTNPLGDDFSDMSLWAFFWVSLLGGVVALLTPCIYPMIPMTVTYFMHNSNNRAKAISQALVYGFSIILIFVLVGTVVAVAFGEQFSNWLSTHWVPNLFFFFIFMVFAASFLGMFELTLPSWMVNKTDKQADKGGYLGAFFMAFTLVLVSFSCTAPIVGSILSFSAQGQVLKPVIGMLGFSLAFALPFTLFAIFPSGLKSLPKSGGWLNSVKVVLGFIELALGLKFLSVADQTYHWGILDREVYLALWIVIFTLMGFYLLGKLKFSHDSELKFVSVPRLLMAVATFAFVVYMIPGLFGAPLKVLSGWVPPMTSQDFNVNEIVQKNTFMVMDELDGSVQKKKSTTKTDGECLDAKYKDQLHLPHGLSGYYDLEQAIECAKAQNKPIFIDFTGHGCVNCRKMEEYVWSDPQVLKRLQRDYIIVALYVDDKKIKLPENEWYVSDYDGKEKKTLGDKNFDIQKSRFNANAQPYYILLDHDGEMLINPHKYNLEIKDFVDFLDKGKAEFEKRTAK